MNDQKPFMTHAASSPFDTNQGLHPTLLRW